MRAVLAWGPVTVDLDIHSVEYNKATKATCHAYYNSATCSGSKWMVDNTGVSSFLVVNEVNQKLMWFSGELLKNMNDIFQFCISS